MFNLQKHFTPTYSKNLIADWSVLFHAILENTTWVRDKMQSQTDLSRLESPLLSNQQIDDALNGPFQEFFKLHFRFYAHISKVEAALTLKNEDFFKDAEHIDKPFGVPESLLTKTDFSSLKELRKQCDNITTEHYSLWQTQIQMWTDALIQEFNKHNIVLSELEIQELYINQPISEIEDRYINLKFTPPNLKKSGCDFQEYFTLRLTLIIHSALGRSQQPHTDKDVEQVLKLFNPVLKAILRAEKDLIKTQEKTLTQLVAGINFK